MSNPIAYPKMSLIFMYVFLFLDLFVPHLYTFLANGLVFQFLLGNVAASQLLAKYNDVSKFNVLLRIQSLSFAGSFCFYENFAKYFLEGSFAQTNFWSFIFCHFRIDVFFSLSDQKKVFSKKQLVFKCFVHLLCHKNIHFN